MSISNEMPQPLSTLTTNQGTSSHILVVDDSPDNLALIRIYLSDCNFKLDYAENGQTAVDKVISDRPDLVLMDLQMPVMDGLEATRTIRRWEANTNTPPIPILAWTAHGAAYDVAESLKAGCNEHLVKPIEQATLLDAISRHIS
jgi:two-component system sensor histidine kinase/response regulator